MTDCSINENYAANGGGMYILGEANLVRCYIHDNVAIGVEHGAGVQACLSGNNGTYYA